MSLTTSVQIVLWLGVASLGLWAGVAGRRAGLVGWQLVRSVIAGLVVGMLVLALQVLLRPSNDVSAVEAPGAIVRRNRAGYVFTGGQTERCHLLGPRCF